MSRITKKAPAKRQLSRRFLETLRKSEALKLEGEHHLAIENLEQLVIEDPGCLEALEEIADNLLSLDEFEKAERTANFALSIDNKSFIANHILGFLKLHEGHWQKAVTMLKIANEGSPNNPEILRCLGWGLFHLGSEAEGVSTLERALTIQESNPMILCDLGICLFQQGDNKEAGKLFERALTIAPDSERVHECLALSQKFATDFDFG
jgi:tetratricopeptide (TPR) repeat protein